MPKRIYLTKSSVEALPYTQNGQATYWDNRLQGFGVLVGRSSKTWFVQKKQGYRKHRITIGRCNYISPDEARRKAIEILAKIAAGEEVAPARLPYGEDVNSEGHPGVGEKMTAREAITAYIETRRISLKAKTLSEYERVYHYVFRDWLDLPLASITRDMVIKRHREAGESNIGKAQTNHAMRVLRAVYYFAENIFEEDDTPSPFRSNPVTRALSKGRSWYKVKRRETRLRPSQFPALFRALEEMKEDRGVYLQAAETASDYMKFILFTGTRRSEAAGLRWEDVDFEMNCFTARDTKNGRNHTLPLGPFVMAMLKRRKADWQEECEYVFPGTVNGQIKEGAHIVDVRKQIDIITKIAEREGIDISFTLHDLRRTFASIAEGLVSGFKLKKLMNHSTNMDITDTYIFKDVEELRESMETVEKTILTMAGGIATPTADRT